LYSSRSNLILGFHGCDHLQIEQLLGDISYFKKSQENFDWLGHGMYFWENNFERARQWSQNKKDSGKISKTAVVGAVIDLGYCFDLLDSSNIELLKSYFELFRIESELLIKPIPKNLKHSKEKGQDKILRFLDCAVIEYTHKLLEEKKERPFDSVRAAFIEGNPIYEGAGFYDKNHIQICIKNPNCIKGIFLPRNNNSDFNWV